MKSVVQSRHSLSDLTRTGVPPGHRADPMALPRSGRHRAFPEGPPHLKVIFQRESPLEGDLLEGDLQEEGIQRGSPFESDS